ncbi:hypothetical protein Mal33_40550 [Rosistilla oblonga]|uniref:Uncharacterized protein n=1 Tax=Rosistilla oblonga TaxID=2527990 RepID=A0A518IY69_9BACT|nr:hypothetical protein Mal33_40550 [Rosistilla oblonga]
MGYFLEGLLEKRRRFAYAINSLAAPPNGARPHGGSAVLGRRPL